ILFARYSLIILLFLIGGVGALTALIVSLGVNFLSDLKEGICLTNILYNRHDCCWQSTYDQSKCKNWNTWSEIFSCILSYQ
ncbi:hypothetical protein MXB_1877, partial [Myxobolus squamalis]